MTETDRNHALHHDRHPIARSRFVLLICMTSLALVTAAFGTARVGHQQITTGRIWPRHELVAFSAIDHATWNDLLKRRVDERGNVDYRGWKASAADSKQLNDYLLALSRAAPDQPAEIDARLVYWINAYNALTIFGILREYPTPSIQQHSNTAKYDIWRDLRLLVGGRPYSLGEIEHAVLRKMQEPRIHFALVCGARGCPRLRNEAYTSKSLENQLQDNTREFFARPGNATFDPAGNGLTVSPLLEWYAEDFGKNDAERLRRIAPYLPKSVAPQSVSREVRLRFGTYDWSLNDRLPAVLPQAIEDSPGAPPDSP